MILVIGGTGKVGSELLKQLAQKGIKAKVLVRSAQKAETVKSLGHEPIEGDFTKVSTLDNAFKGVEKLFLLTTSSSPDRWAADEIAVIKAAKKAGVKKVVLLSAVGSTLDAPITIAREHAKTEEYLKKSGLAYTILQPGGFMQNFLNMTATIKQGAIYGNYKEGKMAFVDARDIAAVAVAALTEAGHDGQTYIITGGESLSYGEVAAKLSHATGKTVKYVDVPTEAAVKGMMGAGMPEWLSKDLAKLGEAIAAGYTGHTTDVVEKVTHKKPISLDQFFKDNVEAFK
jgi:uncharacterized protein YbjT (DUF2867 family)